MPDKEEEIWPLWHVFGTLHNLNMLAISSRMAKDKLYVMNRIKIMKQALLSLQ
jgi:hypothetical protein